MTFFSLIESIPSPMAMQASFGFLATLAGSVVGIPLALRLNKRLSVKDQSRILREQARALATVLEVISDSLKSNTARLESFSKMRNADQLICDAAIDVSSMNAVREDLFNYLADTKLRVDIAQYFSKLGVFRKMNDAFIKSEVVLDPLSPQSVAVRNSLAEQTMELSTALQVEAGELEPLISHALKAAKHRSAGRRRRRDPLTGKPNPALAR